MATNLSTEKDLNEEVDDLNLNLQKEETSMANKPLIEESKREDDKVDEGLVIPGSDAVSSPLDETTETPMIILNKRLKRQVLKKRLIQWNRL